MSDERQTQEAGSSAGNSSEIRRLIAWLLSHADRKSGNTYEDEPMVRRASGDVEERVEGIGKVVFGKGRERQEEGRTFVDVDATYLVHGDPRDPLSLLRLLIVEVVETEGGWPKVYLSGNACPAGYTENLIAALGKDWPTVEVTRVVYENDQDARVVVAREEPIVKEAKRGGRPGLPRDEVVTRVAYALWAEELKQQKPQKTWKEIAREIGWPSGYHKAGVKLLEDARHRLERLRLDGTSSDLEEATRVLVELKRGKETKKTY